MLDQQVQFRCRRIQIAHRSVDLANAGGVALRQGAQALHAFRHFGRGRSLLFQGRGDIARGRNEELGGFGDALQARLELLTVLSEISCTDTANSSSAAATPAIPSLCSDERDSTPSACWVRQAALASTVCAAIVTSAKIARREMRMDSRSASTDLNSLHPSTSVRKLKLPSASSRQARCASASGRRARRRSHRNAALPAVTPTTSAMWSTKCG